MAASVTAMKRAALIAVVVAVAAVIFLTSGPSLDDFHGNDPTGYDACVVYGDTKGAGGSVYRDGAEQAASLGVNAKTSAIRDAIGDGTGDRDGAPVIDDLDAFEDACSEAGYKF
jgi:hypothetical protein